VTALVVVSFLAAVSPTPSAPTAASTVTRVWGPDRFRTAAALSQHTWPTGSPATVYVATAFDFPDALAAGGATGPILLTRTDRLPTPTLTELQRLNPTEVVIVGGTAAVSDQVLTQIQAAFGATGGSGHPDPPPYTPEPCEPSGVGTDYPVGPGQTYPTISDVPWGSLGPGDTIRIFHRPTPYREKIVVRTSGTQGAPIRICGVAGPNGERPILDGDGAVNDADAYGTYAPMEGLAMVLLYERDYDRKVSDIIVEGLHIRNVKNTFAYTRYGGGSAQYEDGAACIRVQAADNVVVRGNVLENCGNGLFTMGQNYEPAMTRNLLVEGNEFRGNGQAGSYREHAAYLQGIDVVVQYNRFGPNAPGAAGAGLKTRAAGVVVRYNWFDSGNVRPLDLVEVEDSAPFFIESEYLAYLDQCQQAADCDEWGPGADYLDEVRAVESRYRVTYVYGNFFRHVGSETDAGNIVHYGSDNDPNLSRGGTLYFYANTVSVQQDRSDLWRFRLFYLGNRAATSPSDETVEVFNNIIYVTGENGQASFFCLDDVNQGTIEFGVNWMTRSWEDPTALSECYYGDPTAGPTVNGAGNLLDTAGAPPPVDRDTLDPFDVPLVRDQAQPVPTGVPAVDDQYLRHLTSAPRPDSSDLGASYLP